MASTVEDYLAQLKAALAGADPALVQDALYDAEDYLRSAVAESDGTPEAFAAVIEAYGTPDEVAAAYRDTDATVARVMATPKPVRAKTAWGRFFGVVADPTAYGSLFYMLLALVTGTAYFTLVVTGLSMTAGFIVLIIGIPFALLFIAAIRAISLAEGRVVETLLGVRMPRRPRTVGQTGSMWDRIKSWFTDYRTWTTMLYMVLMLPLGVTYFTLVVTALALSVSFIAWPLVSWILNIPFTQTFEYAYYVEPWAIPLFMLAGVLGFVLTMWLAKGVGYLHGMFAKVMLVGRFEAASIAPSGTAAPSAPATTPPSAPAE